VIERKEKKTKKPQKDPTKKHKKRTKTFFFGLLIAGCSFLST
jgi:hypothetical protein